MKLRDLPNLITSLRILLVLPLAWVMLARRYDLALWLFFFAGLSDALDGVLARRFGWSSRLGSILDPLADKFLLVACYLVLAWQAALPWWLAALVVARDAIIIGGAVSYHALIERYEMSPTVISKLNTLLQILLVLAVCVGLAAEPLPPALITGMVWGVALSTVWSGVDYVWVWGRAARSKGRQG